MKLLTEALDANVARCGDELALRFLTTGDMDGPVVELTFEEFQRRALRVAEFLSSRETGRCCSTRRGLSLSWRCTVVFTPV